MKILKEASETQVAKMCSSIVILTNEINRFRFYNKNLWRMLLTERAIAIQQNHNRTREYSDEESLRLTKEQLEFRKDEIGECPESIYSIHV